MKKLVYNLILIVSTCAFAQVTGVAKLMGKSDHSGIKVLFKAASPTAFSDSTYTDASGSYSKTLKAGTYAVRFSKAGFNPQKYTQNIFVNGSLTLTSVELLNAIVKEVSGNVSGVWYSDTIYSIVDRITIPAGQSLQVSPGTTIYVNHPYTDFGPVVYAYGKIFLKGTATDSVRVVPVKGDFDKDFFTVLTIDSAVFDFVNSKVAVFNVYASNNEAVNILSNSKFNGLGFYLRGINQIFNNETKGYAWFTFSGNAAGKSHIHCNIFKYSSYAKAFTASPLDAGSDTSKHSLHVHDNYFNFFQLYSSRTEFDLYTYDTSKVVFTNNYLRNISGAFRIIHKGAYFEYKDNTRRDSSYGVTQIFGKYDNLHVINNIFNSGLTTDIENPSFDFTKNQFYEGTSFGNMIGAGIPIDTNPQGSKIDTYGNVIEPPKFTTLPLLAADSPMRGAGVDGTDIGYEPKGTCLEYYFKDSTVDPEPSADTLTIAGKVYAPSFTSVYATVKAVNFKTGKVHHVITNASGEFKIDSLPIGKYYILTEPSLDLGQVYVATYYPKKSTLAQADTLEVSWHIVNMKIYLVNKAVVSLEDEQHATYIYPNPFKEELTLNNPEGEPLQIMDLSGRIVYEGRDHHKVLSTQSWAQGMYLLKTSNTVRKLVKR